MPTRQHDCDHCRHWTIDPAELTGVGNLADTLEALPTILRAVRESRDLSQRAVAREIGVSFSTVSRAESGDGVDASNAAKILRWITDASKQGEA